MACQAGVHTGFVHATTKGVAIGGTNPIGLLRLDKSDWTTSRTRRPTHLLRCSDLGDLGAVEVVEAVDVLHHAILVRLDGRQDQQVLKVLVLREIGPLGVPRQIGGKNAEHEYRIHTGRWVRSVHVFKDGIERYRGLTPKGCSKGQSVPTSRPAHV